MSTTEIIPSGTPDECYRCGYDLRGIDNSQPCPECGLLAERSRRVTDELHNTRPNWLREIALGGAMIVLAVPLGIAAIPVVELSLPQSTYGATIYYWALNWAGPLAGMTVLFVGLRFLTVPEHYPAADAADARLRFWLRLIAAIPLGLALFFTMLDLMDPSIGRLMDIAFVVISMIFYIPLPLLIMLRLRGLAKRARSAHLAEHCVILGIGASISLAYFGIICILTENWSRWFGASLPLFSNTYCVMLLIFLVAAGLFLLWSGYLTIRFAWAFWKAARELRRKWRVDDRSQITIA